MDARAIVACLALLSLDATAGGIYKCVDGGETSYQSAPCARGQSESRMNIVTASASSIPDAATHGAVPAPQSRKRGPWTHAAIEVGISDDEVLNMPGWGRPTQISRLRAARGWEEVWRYGNAYSGQRELRFVNARLTDIVDAPAAVAYVR